MPGCWAVSRENSMNHHVWGFWLSTRVAGQTGVTRCAILSMPPPGKGRSGCISFQMCYWCLVQEEPEEISLAGSHGGPTPFHTVMATGQRAVTWENHIISAIVRLKESRTFIYLIIAWLAPKMFTQKWKIHNLLTPIFFCGIQFFFSAVL